MKKVRREVKAGGLSILFVFLFSGAAQAGYDYQLTGVPNAIERSQKNIGKILGNGGTLVAREDGKPGKRVLRLEETLPIGPPGMAKLPVGPDPARLLTPEGSARTPVHSEPPQLIGPPGRRQAPPRDGYLGPPRRLLQEGIGRTPVRPDPARLVEPASRQAKKRHTPDPAGLLTPEGSARTPVHSEPPQLIGPPGIAKLPIAPDPARRVNPDRVAQEKIKPVPKVDRTPKQDDPMDSKRNVLKKKGLGSVAYPTKPMELGSSRFLGRR